MNPITSLDTIFSVFFANVAVHAWNCARNKIVSLTSTNKQAPSPSSASHGIACSPKSISAIVDISSESKQASCVWFAVVFRLRLEDLTLNFADEFY